MNYIGSKQSLLEFLEQSIEQIAGNDNNRTFCDIFAGTGSVGTHFKKLGYKVIANDMQYYSYTLNRHYVGNHIALEFKGLQGELLKYNYDKDENIVNLVCEYLQALNGKEGFVFRNYCPNDCTPENRMYFTVDNGQKCDAIRGKIEEWKTAGKINDDEYYFLLATLLEAIDKCANTASVYGAFLKKYKKSAQKSIEYKPIPLYENDKEHDIYNLDANELIKQIKTDILYLDPPYNSRQYSANYHVLETIAKNDNPKLKGKTGLRDWSNQKSNYCSKAEVKKSFSDLIANANAKYIFLSYNNEGLLTLEEIREIMSKRGRYGVFETKYNRFKADSKRDYSANTTTEYLHYVEVK